MLGRGGTGLRRPLAPLVLALLAAVLGAILLAAAPPVRADPPPRPSTPRAVKAEPTPRDHARSAQAERTLVIVAPSHPARAAGPKDRRHTPAGERHHRSTGKRSAEKQRHRTPHGPDRATAARDRKAPATSASSVAAAPALAVSAPAFAVAVTSRDTAGTSLRSTTSRAASPASSPATDAGRHQSARSALPSPRRGATPQTAGPVPTFALPHWGRFESPATQLWTIMAVFTGLVTVLIVRERVRRRPGRARSLAS